MSQRPSLHPDRLFPLESRARDLARSLYKSVENLPIISPHGHTDPEWFSSNANFTDPVSLLLSPDHYVLRMLYSQGVPMESLGVKLKESGKSADPHGAWRLFAKHFHLFRGTPSDLWLKHVLFEIFGADRELNEANADYLYDFISSKLSGADFKPRALFDRFKIEFLATTDAATDSLANHQTIHKSWSKKVVPTYRPDSAVDPDHESFRDSLKQLASLTGENTETFAGYLNAHRSRRAFFKASGATATDHGHPTASTLQLSDSAAQTLFDKIQKGTSTPADHEVFRAHMLWRMAEMSVDDGLVMQLHPGSFRNHNPWLMKTFGRDKGADIPVQMEFVRALHPLLESFGNSSKLTMILYTLDETTYARELAPLAGHYPALKLGAPWWFHDSPEGMLRYSHQVIETAGFYNTAGFVDDTRAFLSIPARHDVWRRVQSRFLSELVGEHRLSEPEAFELIPLISTGFAKAAYRV